MLGFKFFFALVLVLCTLGCDSQDGVLQSGFDDHSIDEGVRLQAQSDGSLRGEGRILFTKPLGALRSKERYLVQGEFLKDKAWLNVHSHLSSFDRRDGLQTKFVVEVQGETASAAAAGSDSSNSHSESDHEGHEVSSEPLTNFSPLQDQKLKLSVWLSEPGLTQGLEAESPLAAKKFRFVIEVHNVAPDGPRWLLWNEWISLQGETFSILSPLTLGNRLFDSSEKSRRFFNFGNGPFWGLEFEGVVLTSARRQTPYF